MTTTTPTRPPATFMSQAALAAAVDAAFADALALELADVLATAAPPAGPARPFDLPDTDTLIAQSGIATGPAPRDPHIPSPAALQTRHALAVGGKFAGRAAWLLLKATAYVTAIVAREVLVTTWQLLFGVTSEQQREQLQPAPVRSSDFLLATSEQIERRGWTQHRMQDRYGQVCVLGAEQVLLRAGVGTPATGRRANHHFRKATGARSVPGWNDAWSRRQDHVHAALLAAAARARAAGE